jgi:hypothetical protein
MVDKKKNNSSVKKASVNTVESREEKTPLGGNIKESLIGVLFIDKASGSQIGFIKFDFSGMLIYQMIKTGMHVFAFKSIDPFIKQWASEPLYKKHAKLLEENSKLPDKILEQEANGCADFLNSLESPLNLGGFTVKAQMVHSES